jgi:hypothetical protein
MRRISIRLPDDLIRAYDMADTNSRSEAMRAVLTDAVANGHVEGVPDDLRKLAERERVVDTGRLARKRATYKSRVYGFYGDKWETGAITPTDARDLAASWRSEAKLYDSDDDADTDRFEEFLDAVLDWYAANWSTTAAERPEWPDAGRLLRNAGITDDEQDASIADAELVEQVDDWAADNVDRGDALKKLVDEEGITTTDAFAVINESEAY